MGEAGRFHVPAKYNRNLRSSTRKIDKKPKNPLGKRCFFNGGEGGIRIPSPIEAVKKSLSTLKKASKIMATGDNVCKTSSWIYLKRNGNKKS
jgi:hypothetical protein